MQDLTACLLKQPTRKETDLYVFAFYYGENATQYAIGTKSEASKYNDQLFYEYGWRGNRYANEGVVTRTHTDTLNLPSLKNLLK